jgi:chorismate mutase
MKKDVVKKFTRFLKERGAYTEFITEFKRQTNIETRIGWAETEV